MKQSFLLIITIAICSLFTSCSEEHVAAIDSPQLATRGIRSDQVTFTYTIQEKDAQGTLYCLLQSSDEAAPGAQQLMENRFTLVIPLNGRTFNQASFPGLQAQTAYTIYALIEMEGNTSSISRVAFTTP